MQKQNPKVRMMVLGYPKAGKTGALASLVNSGKFEIGLLDFDHNPDPLYAYVDPRYFERVSILTLEDVLEDKDNKKLVVKGEPTAFRNGFRAIDHWVDDAGLDWGPVKDWGPERILVVDSLTSMGEAAFRRRRGYRTQGRMGDDQESDWGAAQRDQMNFVEHVSSPRFACNVLVLSHIKQIEPKILRETPKDSEDIKKAKAAISLARAENTEIRKYPSALGNAIAPEIARFLPAVVLVDGDRQGRRKIITSGEPGFDLGVPAKGLDRVLPLETGLLTIFEAILNG